MHVSTQREYQMIQYRITASKSPPEQAAAYHKAVVAAQRNIELAKTCCVEAKATVAAAIRAEELALNALTAEDEHLCHVQDLLAKTEQ